MYFELTEIIAGVITVLLPWLCTSYTKYQAAKITKRMEEE